VSNAERVIEAFAAAGLTGSGPVDEAEIERLTNAVASLAKEDFVTKMISVEGVAMSARGADGMREVLADWTGVFEEMRFEVEGIEERGENAILLAQMISVTRVGGVTMEQPSATVLKFRDGRIYRAEWHMDRAAAERSAVET
jgi:ketosteroid isomerase-like protein